MPEEHWFDALNKALVHDAPRRAVLRWAVAIAMGFSFARFAAATLAKKRKHKKAKRKKAKRKRKKPSQTSCSGGACAREWAGNQAEIDYCEFVCRQCGGDDPRQFCIVRPDPSDPNGVAVCCDAAAECCGDRCCGDPRFPELRCCSGECVNTYTDDLHCGRCDNPCSPGKACDNGVCVCQEGLTLCGEICRDLERDENNCGQCDQRCLDPNRPDCCNGQCVNTRYDPRHCGRCDHRCERYEFCTSTGDCRCSYECCNGNDSGVCVGPRFCCQEPCSLCVPGECLRWRDDIVGGYCEERVGTCQVVSDYCPIDDLTFDCCADNETCTSSGCVPR